MQATVPGLQAWHYRAMWHVRIAGAIVAGMTALFLVATASAAGAAVAITVPSSKNLGTAATGTARISAQLGSVSVTASGLVAPSFTATVSTTVFVTGSGGTGQTIGKASVRYWSGPATSVTGLLGGGTPGQATAANAQDLSVSRTAFSGQGTLLNISVTWNPTLIIDIPTGAVAGSYTGTITHSVA
jgi:hypothetical protein